MKYLLLIILALTPLAGLTRQDDSDLWLNVYGEQKQRQERLERDYEELDRKQRQLEDEIEKLEEDRD